MPVIDHFLYAAFYLPARSCSLEPSPWHRGALAMPPLLLLSSPLLCGLSRSAQLAPTPPFILKLLSGKLEGGDLVGCCEART